MIASPREREREKEREREREGDVLALGGGFLLRLVSEGETLLCLPRNESNSEVVDVAVRARE